MNNRNRRNIGTPGGFVARRLFRSLDSRFESDSFEPSGGNALSLIDKNDSTHKMVVSGGTVLAPTSTAGFGGALSINLTGAQILTSNRASSEWIHLHSGTGSTTIVAVIPANNTGFQVLAGTTSGTASGASITRTNTSGDTYFEGFNNTTSAFSSTRAASTTGVAEIYCGMLRTGEFRFYKNGTLVQQGTPGTLGSNAVASLQVGIGVNTVKGNLALLWNFKRYLSDVELAIANGMIRSMLKVNLP